MAFFLYQDSAKGRRKGIRLRVSELRRDASIGPIVRRHERGEPGTGLSMAEIAERMKDETVVIKLWFTNIRRQASINKRVSQIYMASGRGGPRLPLVFSESKVLRIHAKEDPNWVCESDEGRGANGGAGQNRERR
jgi:hypothetical protein